MSAVMNILSQSYANN